MKFEWDYDKASSNLAKHSVSFEEATTVFGDTLSFTVPDPDHSEDEERFLIFGINEQGRHLVISFTERGDRIRFISARQMTRREIRAYEQ